MNMIRIAGLAAALLSTPVNYAHAANCTAHWSCSGSRHCATVMGGAYGNSGPFNSFAECTAWANQYNRNTTCSCSGDSADGTSPSAAEIEQQRLKKDEEEKLTAVTQSIERIDEDLRNNDLGKSNTPMETQSSPIPESAGQLNFNTSSSIPTSNPAPSTQMDFSSSSTPASNPRVNTQLEFSAGTAPSKELFNLTIYRQYSSDQCTSGYLAVNGTIQAYTLERPWAGNEPLISSIPAGKYEGILRYDHTDQWRIELIGVPGRSNVQIHTGNTTDNTKGCIIVGKQLGDDRCSIKPGTSRPAYRDLKNAFYGTPDPVSTPDKDIRVTVDGN